MEMMTVGVLEIVRESSGLLCAHLPILLFIMLTLIFPVSCVRLSHVLTSASPLAHKLSSHLHAIAAAAGLPTSPIHHALFTFSSHALLSHLLSFPIILTLSLLAQTATLYILHRTHLRRKEPSLLSFLRHAPNLWTRLATTYLYTCVLFFGFASLAMASPLLLLALARSLDPPPPFLPLLGAPLVLALSVGFAHVLAVSDVAHVVSVAENKCGGGALLRAVALLRGRVPLALLLLLLSELAAFMADGAFQSRVMRSGAPTSLCEAPLLVFLHSFVHLFHTIMSFVFYRSCLQQSSSSICESPPSPDALSTLQHVSIAVEMTEQCRKTYSV